MTDNEPLDLSPLDPAREPDEWSATVRHTLERIEPILERREPDPLTLIATWSRPVLIAAAAAVAILVPVEVALEDREDRVEQVERLVSLSSSMQRPRPLPTGSDFLRALKEDPGS
jgi:hypothetical protein